MIPSQLLKEFASLTRAQELHEKQKDVTEMLEKRITYLEETRTNTRLIWERQYEVLHDEVVWLREAVIAHARGPNNEYAGSESERSSSPVADPPRVPDSNDSLPSYLDEAGQDELWNKTFNALLSSSSGGESEAEVEEVVEMADSEWSVESEVEDDILDVE